MFTSWLRNARAVVQLRAKARDGLTLVDPDSEKFVITDIGWCVAHLSRMKTGGAVIVLATVTAIMWFITDIFIVEIANLYTGSDVSLDHVHSKSTLHGMARLDYLAKLDYIHGRAMESLLIGGPGAEWGTNDAESLVIFLSASVIMTFSGGGVIFLGTLIRRAFTNHSFGYVMSVG